MAQKTFIKAFSDFQGINRGTNDLVRPKNQCKVNNNFELDDDYSLVLRRGEKAISGVDITTSEVGVGVNFTGLLKHVYSDKNTGAFKENGLVFQNRNDTQFCKQLRYGSLIITGSNLTYSMIGKADGTGYQFYLYQNDIQVFTFNCGLDNPTGVLSSLPTLNQLVTALNGASISGVTASLTNNGILTTGLTTPSADIFNVTVNAGHTFVLGGDFLVAGMSFLIVKVNGNVLSLGQQTATVALTSSQAVGLGILPAHIIKIAEKQPVLNGIIIPYLGTVQTTLSINPFIDANTSINFFPPNGANLANSLFIGGLYKEPFNSSLTSAGTQGLTGILKYDGNCLYQSGLPVRSYSANLASGTGGLTVGYVYQYRHSLIYEDAQGYEIESELSDIITVTPTTGNTFVKNYANIYFEPSEEYANLESNTFSGGAITITTTGTVLTLVNANRFKLNDIVYVFSGIAQKCQIIALTATTITLKSLTNASISVNSGTCAYISTCKVQVWRTKAGGNNLYKTISFPYVQEVSIGVIDNFPDASLGTAYPLLSEQDRRFRPPILHAVTEHQGSLIGIGNYNNPNTVTFSSQESPEYMNPTNSFEASGNSQGKLRALKSDNESMLALFKDDGYYNVVGDLITGNFSFDIVTEGSIGCSSQNAIQRVRDFLIFPSSVGFFKLKNGQLDLAFNESLIYDFRGQTTNYAKNLNYETKKLNLSKAVSCNDVEEEKYICSIPSEYGATSSYVANNSKTKTYTYDYSKNAWYERTYGDYGSNKFQFGLVPYLGMTIIDKIPTWITIGQAGLYNGLVQMNRSGTAYDYITGGKGIEGKLKLQSEDLNEPSINKEFLQLKIFSLNPILDELTKAFTVTINTYKNFTNTLSTNKVVNFIAGTIEYFFKLKPDQIKALEIEILNKDASSNFVINNPIRITGIELNVSDSYLKEEFRK